MSEQKVNELSTATPALTDYIMGMSGTAEYKALVSAVAKKIVEDYAGSSLAGSNQSVKAALDTLNSTLTPQVGSVTLNSDAVTQHSTFQTRCVKSGGAVFAVVAVTTASALTSGTVLATLSTGYRPGCRIRTFAFISGNSMTPIDIGIGGVISNVAAIESGKTIIVFVNFVAEY